MQVAAIGILPTLTACAGNKLPASVSGVCGVFTDPGFAVRGATRKDQAWISITQETGIQVCDWKRPAKLKVAVLSPKLDPDAVPMPLPAKKRWWRR